MTDLSALIDGVVEYIDADWWHDGQVDYESGKKEIERVKRVIKQLVADYIESIELPKHREMTEEMTPPKELAEAYLSNQLAMLDDLNGVTDAYNQALKDCQAKLDETVKYLKENK